MKLFLVVILLSAISFKSTAQTPAEEDQESIFNKIESIPVDLLDSFNISFQVDDTSQLYYLVLKPKVKIKAALVLFSGAWEHVESVAFNNKELLEESYKNGVLVVIPSINFNVSLDDFSLKFINIVSEDILSKYKAPAKKVVFGGFSLGGMNALRYAEMAYEGTVQCVLKPAAVYGVDPPLDFERMYGSFQRTIDKNFSEAAVNEAEAFTEKMKADLGEFDEQRSNYYQNSVYSKSQKNGGNAVHLVSIPVRIYSDPDIDWHLANRRVDFYDINAIDQTALINQLHLLGNERAEYVNCLGKGYRSDGARHPHSWSLVNPQECVEWILYSVE